MPKKLSFKSLVWLLERQIQVSHLILNSQIQGEFHLLVSLLTTKLPGSSVQPGAALRIYCALGITVFFMRRMLSHIRNPKPKSMPCCNGLQLKVLP